MTIEFFNCHSNYITQTKFKRQIYINNLSSLGISFNNITIYYQTVIICKKAGLNKSWLSSYRENENNRPVLQRRIAHEMILVRLMNLKTGLNQDLNNSRPIAVPSCYRIKDQKQNFRFVFWSSNRFIHQLRTSNLNWKEGGVGILMPQQFSK